jgi:hypothetical protein
MDGMTIESLTPDIQTIVRRALAFVSTTRRLDDDFETRLGVGRGVLAEILMRWPAVDDRDDHSPTVAAINNALNEVANGFDLSTEEWRQLGATRAEVESAYLQWTTSRGWQSTGLR